MNVIYVYIDVQVLARVQGFGFGLRYGLYMNDIPVVEKRRINMQKRMEHEMETGLISGSWISGQQVRK